MSILIHPTYFPNIITCIALLNAKKVVFEYCDHYQKQTYRNRTYIYSSNGKLALQIPVHYSQHRRQQYKDVKIAYKESWQQHHWRSINTAYSNSPFFEFYKDDLQLLFKHKETYLFDYNIKCLETILNCIAIKIPYTKTKTYKKEPNAFTDLRYLVNAKKNKENPLNPYNQVFDLKHGFISNLSILDLLCNEGPNTKTYCLDHNMILI